MILLIMFVIQIGGVPPKLSLSFDGLTLANKTYVGDHNYNESKGKEPYVEGGKEINVTCLAKGAKPQANLTWTINGEAHDGVDLTTNTNREENRTFDSRSTLRFIPTGPNITITCNSSLQGTDIETLISATFLTYVKPAMLLTVNGVRVLSAMSSVRYVTENEEVNITCHAVGARPAPQLTWMENYSYSVLQQNETIYNTFDITSTLTFKSSKGEEVFTCMSRIYEVDITDEINLTLISYVLPEPSLTVNGNSSDIIFIDQEEGVTVTCDALDTRPEPILTWTMNAYEPYKTKVQIKTLSHVFSTLKFHPQHNDTVTCILFLGGPNKTRSDSVKFYFKGKRTFPSYDYSKWTVPCIVASSIFLLVFIVHMTTKKLKAQRSANLPTACRNFGIRMVERLHTLPKGLPKDDKGTVPKPPNLPLPKIPSGSEISYYSNMSEEEDAHEVELYKEYQSNTSNNDARSKYFTENDISFILNLKMGHIYNRWMGNIAVSKEVTKSVILSTVTESVVRKRELQWDKFLRTVIELPDTINLIKVEGICIKEGKLYLINDYNTGETLDGFISLPIFPTELLGHVLGILDGMEVIQSFGLLHPGLSTKKVLRTKQGTCKLYDFCLSDDASNVVKIKTSQMSCSVGVNQFAPEALLRNEYSMASDVWSLAVVIWEMLSCGSPPFSNEQELPYGSKVTFPENCPDKYNSLRNKRLYECWNNDASLRPTICQLRLSFLEIFESLDTYNLSDGDSYVPMKGAEK